MTATMNISLPKALRDFVRRRIEEERFANASDYIRTLIRADRKRAARDELERLLLEGLRSGKPRAWDERTIAEVRRKAMAGLAKRGRRLAA